MDHSSPTKSTRPNPTLPTFPKKWWKYNPWLISDSHFFHSRIVDFNSAKDGTPIRPWNDYIQMTNDLISNWNECVAPDDLIIHLGDISFGGVDRFHECMSQLNGKKILIKGNHDLRTIDEYLLYFEDVWALGEIPHNKAILTHIPVHDSQLKRFRYNICGHLHNNKVMYKGSSEPDTRYRCVSVEQTNFKPIRLDDVLKELDQANEKWIKWRK